MTPKNKCILECAARGLSNLVEDLREAIQEDQLDDASMALEDLKSDATRYLKQLDLREEGE